MAKYREKGAWCKAEKLMATLRDLVATLRDWVAKQRNRCLRREMSGLVERRAQGEKFMAKMREGA